ncbi:MAG: hypothetical protein DMF11_01865 [Verrucomicrobia bacterium]|nr:MAG: hypothetical protein DMF11_01865 [Verrucomicrobiota bacterium]
MYAGGISYFSTWSFGFSRDVAVSPEAVASAVSETSQINEGAVETVEYFISGCVNCVVEALSR